MGTTHGAEELGLCSHGLACQAGRKRLYSLTSENVTKIKRNSAQILSYKIFSFCEQILKIGANDASGKMLQFAL